MAKVMMSAAVGRASGKVGAVVFSRGPFGDVVGIKSTPINSESNKQMGIRGSFAALSKRWSAVLTPTQQAGWIALSSTNGVKDIFNNTIHLTGVQFYIKLNGSLHAIGLPPIDTAPGALATGSPGALTISAQATPAAHLTVTPTTPPAANEVPVVWSMRSLALGTKAVKEKLTIVKYFPAGTAGPWDILSEWNQDHGQLSLGVSIVAMVRYTANDTGFQGLAFQDFTIAT